MKINENDLLPNSEVFVLENGEPTKKKIEDLFKNILYFQKTRTFGSYQMLDEIKTQKICMGHLCWSDTLG